MSEETLSRKTCEEQDLFDRSTKKMKTSTESPMGETSQSKEAGMTGVQVGKLSFKQVVTNESATVPLSQTDLDLISDDEEEDPGVQIDGGCPVIRLTKEEKLQLRSKWKQTLIVKVLRISVGYAYLLKRLIALWHPKARMELVTIEGGYFLVKFASLEDYEFAQYGGPWMVLDHYLVVKEWVPNFDPLTGKTETVIVWVHFSCLSAKYYDYKFLMRVGGKIGRAINIDTATSLVSRAMFARICVEVDITKPLLSKFTLRIKVRGIVNEGLHLICFKCGMYGHNAESCPRNHEHADGEDYSAYATDDGKPTAETDSGNATQGSEKGKNYLSKEKTQVRPEVTEDYGS